MVSSPVNLSSSVNCTEPSTVSLVSVVVSALVVVNIIVIVGNSLVICAVLTHIKLRSATNTFIVSLAAADLLLGLTVLPFSSAHHVLRGHWPFGGVWCRVWLAVDVWLCTASILNLCAISIDRYLAISRPFRYPRLMSPRRAKLLVAVVWLVAFIICFPPLVGWNARRGRDVTNASHVMATEQDIVLWDTNNSRAHVSNHSYNVVDDVTCSGVIECDLEADSGYRIYSAFGSFWIPVWVMVFFYWRIYTTAARTTKALRRGVITKKMTSKPDCAVTLRVHRGGGGKQTYTTTSPRAENGARCRENLSLVTRDPTSDDTMSNASTQNSNASFERKQPPTIKITFSKKRRYDDDIRPNQLKQTTDRLTTNNVSERLDRSGREVTGRSDRSGHEVTQRSDSSGNGVTQRSDNTGREVTQRSDNTVHEVTPRSNNTGREVTQRSGREVTRLLSSDTDSMRFSVLRKGGSHVKSHLKRLNKEKKAAKTVGVIVGAFIVCWAPFFTVYLVDAFCTHCTPSLLFTIFFWLGYCNSALNPCLYALCSKDFRNAFKRLLCCERRTEHKRSLTCSCTSDRPHTSSRDSNSE